MVEPDDNDGATPTPEEAGDAPPAERESPAPAEALPAESESSAPAKAPPAEPESPALSGTPPAEPESPAPAGGPPAVEPEAPGEPAKPAEAESPGGVPQAGDRPQPPGARKGKRRRSRRRPPSRGPRRFQWDEVFLRQRLDLLRAMDADPEAIAWAVKQADRFVVAEILAGEGSSGKEFGRRAYAAEPETDDQAAWIVLAAVRAREILPVARRVVTGIEDQRQQVASAIERLGVPRVSAALGGEGETQQVFAERARRVDVAGSGGEEQKAAWSLLALARSNDVRAAVAPSRPRQGDRGRPGGRSGPPGGRNAPPGQGRPERRPRREPGIPGGIHSVGGGSGGGVGSQLGEALREALRQAQEAETSPDEPPAG